MPVNEIRNRGLVFLIHRVRKTWQSYSHFVSYKLNRRLNNMWYYNRSYKWNVRKILQTWIKTSQIKSNPKQMRNVKIKIKKTKNWNNTTRAFTFHFQNQKALWCMSAVILHVCIVWYRIRIRWMYLCKMYLYSM